MDNTPSKNTSNQEKFWSDYSNRYHNTLYEDVKEYPSLVIRHNYILDLFDLGPCTVADIGCGPGEMLSDLIEKGCTVFGVDIAQGMIDVARQNIQKKHPGSVPDLRIGDIEKLDFTSNMFDCVICAGVLEYMENDDKALNELNRILKPGGTLIITVRNKICPFRIVDIISDFLKETSIGITILNKMRSLINKDPIRYIPYRKHIPYKFDRTLEKFNFLKESYRFFHFYPFFIPFDKLFPKQFIRYGLKMERFSDTKLGVLGSGYIVKAIKKH